MDDQSKVESMGSWFTPERAEKMGKALQKLRGLLWVNHGGTFMWHPGPPNKSDGINTAHWREPTLIELAFSQYLYECGSKKFWNGMNTWQTRESGRYSCGFKKSLDKAFPEFDYNFHKAKRIYDYLYDKWRTYYIENIPEKITKQARIDRAVDELHKHYSHVSIRVW